MRNKDFINCLSDNDIFLNAFIIISFKVNFDDYEKLELI